MAYITLRGGFYAAVDTADLPRVLQHHWGAFESRKGYWVVATARRVAGRRRTIYLSRYLLDAPEGMEVDHLNRNTFDNRRENLRLATSAQNRQNLAGAYKNSETGIRGVSVRRVAGRPRQYAATVGRTEDGRRRYWVRRFPFTPAGLQAACEAVVEMRREVLPFSTEGGT